MLQSLKMYYKYQVEFSGRISHSLANYKIIKGWGLRSAEASELLQDLANKSTTSLSN